LGFIVELQTPGVGLPGVLGITSLALVFFVHWLVQLVGWEELLFVGIGFVLLVLEVFVTPGFGVLGALGLVSVLGGLGLGLVGAGARWEVILMTAGRVVVSLLLAIAGALAMLRILPRL